MWNPDNQGDPSLINIQMTWFKYSLRKEMSLHFIRSFIFQSKSWLSNGLLEKPDIHLKSTKKFLTSTKVTIGYRLYITISE